VSEKIPAFTARGYRNSHAFCRPGL